MPDTIDKRAEELLSAIEGFKDDSTFRTSAERAALIADALRKQNDALRLAATVLKDSIDDWRVVAGEDSIIYLRVNNALRVVRDAIEGE